jgi:3'-phosphoadenosine 5'-phosphosulfate sulfotransferase (PAPS reductase)/FAD synthetase
MSIAMTAACRSSGAEFDVATDATIFDAVRRNAWFVFNLSGGKDSTATSHAAMAWLDRHGHPRTRRIAVHADLGKAEWRSTLSFVEGVTQQLDLPLLVLRRRAGDMVDRWEQRFTSGKNRYEALSTYNLIGPWSSASLRFCTSELKIQVIGPDLARRYKGETIVSVIGLRREESPSRRFTPVSRTDERFAKAGNAAGTRMLSWHPGVDWSSDDIFAYHARHDLALHEVYCRYRSTRLSCAFCVLASAHDLQAATQADDNLDLYRHLVSMEADSTFSFQPQRWLADAAPHLLPQSLAMDVARAKRDAIERRLIERAMPAGLRFVKGWPPRLPTLQEAGFIATARAPILSRHGLDHRYPDALSVQRRFAELLADKRIRAA